MFYWYEKFLPFSAKSFLICPWFLKPWAQIFWITGFSELLKTGQGPDCRFKSAKTLSDEQLFNEMLAKKRSHPPAFWKLARANLSDFEKLSGKFESFWHYAVKNLLIQYNIKGAV